MKLFKKGMLLSFITIQLIACSKDDEPQNTPPVIKAQSFTVAEDKAANSNIGTIIATDVDKDDLIFKITKNDDDLFAVNTSGNLSITANKSLDYETQTKHEITVEVSDGKDKASAVITINVTDVVENEAPKIDDQSFEVSEDAATGVTLATIVATDPNNDAITFTLDDDSLFTFSSSNEGKLQLATGKSLDFESKTTYELMVTVSDGVYTSTATITINITDVNEAPVITDSSYVNDVAENINDDDIIAEIVAVDPENDVINYSITSDSDQLFEIENQGKITLKTGESLDYETKTSHTITVRVTDNKALYTEETFTIKVTDVNENSSTVSTIVGATNGSDGDVNGTGTSARFNTPWGIAYHGGFYYVADLLNHKIKRINSSTLEVTTFAGSTKGFADGTGTVAMFNAPSDLVIDNRGNVYVSDKGNNRIRKITPNGVVTTLAGSGAFGNVDGIGSTASFSSPSGLCFYGDDIYVADAGNHTIRKVTPNGTVTTFAGSPDSSGYANGDRLHEAKFNNPVDVTADSRGTIYVSDNGNHVIRSINSGGTVRLYAGVPESAGLDDGSVFTGKLNNPQQITIAGDRSNELYIADYGNHAIRKVTRVVTGNTGSLHLVTVVGKNGQGNVDGDENTAKLNFPAGIIPDSQSNNNILITDSHAIRKVKE
ncbi:cadherin domain-containing protein [Zhouia spongiae]|uniref:Cadherin domain-containing protein n=1 Tax=Zhouia spongiae TaxID=2202721 RepID=A0ABY3YMJ2_9FLAO|nr:cadherin domain-containing protein [Zhouia spongiae]UNY99022.1 cadherin domain-containing protein [Zhouia spongiae]